MDAPPTLWLVAKGVLLLAGLIVPGAAVMRALRVPTSIASCFAGSALALYATVLALQLGNVPISLGTLVAGLGVIIFVARFSARRHEEASSPPPSLLTRTRNYTPLTGMGVWAPLYFLFLAAALWRAWHEPLAGPDIEFRWGF